MKKLATVLSTAGLLSTALVSGSALAYSDAVMDPGTSYDTAVKVRQVNYTCQSNKKVSVTYGFNRQSLPTYAQSYLNGKSRYMPINLGRSDDVDTVFGDENNFSVMTDSMKLSNYHKLAINVQSPSSEILYKSCRVVSVNKLKG